MNRSDRTSFLAFLAVLAFFIVGASFYSYVNWVVLQQVFTLLQDNLFTVWFVTLAFVIIFGILFRFFSNQAYSLIAISFLLTLFGSVTLITFYFNSTWEYFVPNGPIASALQTGDLPLGILGFFIMFVTGFAFSLLITKSLSHSAYLGLGIGAGLITLEALSLSFLKLFYPLYVLVLSLSVMVALLFFTRKNLTALRKISLKNAVGSLKNRSTVAVLGVGAAFFTIIIFEAIAYPSTEWDSLAYGLPYAKIIYQLHTIPLISGPSIGIEISANYPPGMQLLASFFYGLSGGIFDIYYRLLEPTLAVALLLAVYRLGCIVFEDRRYAAISVLAVFSFPIWYYAIGTSYVMFTAAESAIVLFAALAWRKTAQDRFLVLSGIAAGFASLTSYIGFLCFLFPLMLILVESRSSIKIGKRILILLMSGFFSAVWLVRNFILLGNPLYPLGGRGLNLTPLLYQSTSAEIIDNANAILRSFNSFLQFTLNESNGLEGPMLFIILLGVLLFFISKKGTFSRSRHESISIALVMTYAVVGFVIVTFANGFFLRYFVPFSPGFALGFAFIYRELAPSKFPARILLVFLAVGLIMSGLTIEGYAAVPNQNLNSQLAYLYQKFGQDALSWNWINTHTPPNAVIATYEIRTYYINRTVVPLDGYKMVGLYGSDQTIGQILGTLHSQNVSYILSVGWASPASGKTPAAYYESVLTKYLGDPSYFPTVYANPTSAVYEVAGNVTSTDPAFLPTNSTVYLPSNQPFVTTLTNRTSPPSSMINIPIQPDLTGDQLSISEDSPTTNTSLDWFPGTIPTTLTNGWWNSFSSMARSPPLRQGLGSVNPALRIVAEPGYYTLVIVDRSNYTGPTNVTIDISIMPSYEFNSLIPSAGQAYFRQLTQDSAYSALYYTPNESGQLEIKLPSGVSYSSFAVYNYTVPFNGYQGWAANYELNAVTPSRITSSSKMYNVSGGIGYSFVVFNGTSTSSNFAKLSINITLVP